MRTTYMAKESDIERRWFLIDAEGQTLGRLAAQVAIILRGKHKPTYTPHADTGDHVIIVNCEKVVLTGHKWRDKLYRHHSGYPGGLKEESAQAVLAKRPERLLETAIRGMLPHNRLGRQMYRKLRVYKGPDHPHVAQQPEPLKP